MNRSRSTFKSIVLLLLLGTAATAVGQRHQEQEREREEMQAEQRVEQREERSDHAAIATLKEQVKHNEDEVAALEKSINDLWEAHRKTDAIANSAQAQVATFLAIAKPVGAAFLFVLGIVVTRVVNNFMSRRKAGRSKSMTAGSGN